MKKSISLFLAVLMIVATMPMALAAETLKAANIQQYPTMECITEDGKIHYGQTLGEALKINDDEIVVDAAGNQVAGHFEFMKPTLISTPAENVKTNLKFIPDDTTAYSGFNKLFCADLTYTVIATTPLYVDETNDPVVATEVEPGATLSTSVLSGGKMYNPYNATEPNIAAETWIWADSTAVVNESGYYEAVFYPIGYVRTTAQVYVKVASSIPETNIAEYPTIDELTYNPNITFADVKLNGGKAVIKGTDTEVKGTFAFVNPSWIPTPETTEIEVVFTPDNAEEALPYQFKIPVIVNKAPVAFLDENGNAVTEGFEFEVTPNEKMAQVESLVKKVLRVPEKAVIGVEYDNDYAENGKQYRIKIIHDDPNYVGSELYFTVKFKETKVVPEISGIGLNTYKIKCDYSMPGTFAVAVMKDGALVDTIVTKSGAEFKFEPTSSGKYTFNVAYVPTEGDYFVVDAFSKEFDIKLSWATTIDGIIGKSNCGDTVEARTINTTGFIGWKATDANGNPVTLTLVSGTMESETFSFIMPDHNVVLTPEFEGADDGSGDIDLGDIDGIDGAFDWILNLLNKIKAFFGKIIEFFQSIGDMT